MKTTFLFSIILLFAGSLSGQRNGHARAIKDNFHYVNPQMTQTLYDAIIRFPGENGTQFNIGKICQEIGCEGVFTSTGKHQTAWAIYQDSIILVYVTPLDGYFKTELLIYQYSERWEKFVLLE